MNQSATNSSSMSIPALTGVRFLAAMTVVVSHFSQLNLLNIDKNFLDFVDGGRLAVSFFFVLSGYILVINYNERKTDSNFVKRFIIARLARLYPIMLVGLAIAITTVLTLAIRSDFETLTSIYSLKKDFLPGLFASFVSQLLLLTAWFPFATINQPWNGPAWSISCEAFFYALFPFLLIKLSRLGKAKLILVVILLWAAQGLWILFIERTVPLGRKGFLISQFPVTHFFEFIAGMVAGIFTLSTRQYFLVARQAAFAMTLISVSTLICLQLFSDARPAYFFASPFFAVLVAGLSLWTGIFTSILGSKPAVLLGESSYALYMLHIPLAHLAIVTGASEIGGALLLALVIAFSIAAFKWIEEPSRTGLRNKLGKYFKA